MNSLAELLRSAAPSRATGRAPTSTRAPLSAARYASINVALRAIASIHQWAETDDLDDGETYADRLIAQMVGLADANKDGEITDDEQEVLRVAMNSAWDYLASLGAIGEDLDALLNDWDARTADCIRDLVTAVTPEDDRAAIAAVNSFVFGPATRAHSKAVVRIAGPVRLSARQRLAVRQAHEKSQKP